jgi:hypothetical protein
MEDRGMGIVKFHKAQLSGLTPHVSDLLLQNAARHGWKIEKVRAIGRRAARLGFFRGFSNRAGGNDGPARLRKGPHD